MSKIPCELIRDILPSYVDGLTDPVTNREVEAHVAGCPDCRNALEAMKTPEPVPVEQEPIDFLRKNRKRNRRIAVGSIVAAAVIVCAALLIRTFFIGHSLYGDWVDCEPQVDGTHLVLDGTTDFDPDGIGRITFTEVDGMVTASAKVFHHSPFHRNSFHAEYTASAPITQVRFNDRILWSEGETISRLASQVYGTRHDYMGDASANDRTARALNVGSYLGPYTNELHTAQQPYDWTLVLEENIAPEDRLLRENDMESLAYAMLAVIDNLDSVTYEYTVNGETCAKTITTADATAFFGQDIKSCGLSVRLLNDLIAQTGLRIV